MVKNTAEKEHRKVLREQKRYYRQMKINARNMKRLQREERQAAKRRK